MANVYLISEPQINFDELGRFLEGRGWEADPVSDAELLPEIMGRLCFDSFDTQNNLNITRTRKGNEEYLKNILQSGHHSVLEHSNISFIFQNVSRVFTHELITHRIGIAKSQESLRYVRLDPSRIQFVGDDEVIDLHGAFYSILQEYSKLTESLDWQNMNTNEKKKASSLLRRLLPQGMATNIGWTANFRALRHVINLRTSDAAEEEIQLVFNKVKDIVKQRYPNIFGDM